MMSCCEDMRFHLCHKTVTEEGYLGVCLHVILDRVRRVVPLFHCPWCGAELRPKETRPKGTFYFS